MTNIKEMATLNPCDNCERVTNVIRLDTGGNSGVFLCRKCWKFEMIWRQDRNLSLAPENKFDILKWPG